ncbi:MAG: hypothetical protein M1814_002233 [Vezdaea aestivalis]|nr:MAG: hypothetical protein M1814_002233 [Vezdaea aestivalis]
MDTFRSKTAPEALTSAIVQDTGHITSQLIDGVMEATSTSTSGHKATEKSTIKLGDPQIDGIENALVVPNSLGESADTEASTCGRDAADLSITGPTDGCVADSTGNATDILTGPEDLIAEEAVVGGPKPAVAHEKEGVSQGFDGREANNTPVTKQGLGRGKAAGEGRNAEGNTSKPLTPEKTLIPRKRGAPKDKDNGKKAKKPKRGSSQTGDDEEEPLKGPPKRAQLKNDRPSLDNIGKKTGAKQAKHVQDESGDEVEKRVNKKTYVTRVTSRRPPLSRAREDCIVKAMNELNHTERQEQFPDVFGSKGRLFADDAYCAGLSDSNGKNRVRSKRGVRGTKRQTVAVRDELEKVMAESERLEAEDEHLENGGSD